MTIVLTIVLRTPAMANQYFGFWTTEDIRTKVQFPEGLGIFDFMARNITNFRVSGALTRMALRREFSICHSFMISGSMPYRD
ncbi:MAG: hypothetical protein ACLFUN_10025 [Desulfobacterales bacterium]